MFLQQLINGLTIGSSYALVAIGYTLVFGVLELVNFSHSSVFMFGAYLAAVVLSKFVNVPAAFVTAIGLCGLFGISIDRFALLPMRRRGASRVSYLICTIGLSTVLQNIIFLIFGSEPMVYPQVILTGRIRVANAVISYLQIFTLVLLLVLMVLTSLLVYKSKIGSSMRAISQNEEAARLMGINVDTIITFTFFLGSALAAVAGIMVGMYYGNVDLTMGFTVGMKTFASAVLGGIGILPGAVIGGLSIGVIESLFAGYISSGYKDAVAFIILIIVLLIKPTGLLGKKNVMKV
ncbi:MAG: branched-chain amino acid ABC transporter permease [Saccharofermentanales bacterium]|jgi:branched-chain amino acid transport system permease protein